MDAMSAPTPPEPSSDIVVSQEDDGRRGGFVAERDGQTLGEMDYSRPQADLMIIEHTEVAAAARGLGVGRMLLDAAVAWARREHARIMPLCPYARSVFNKDESIRDVLAS